MAGAHQVSAHIVEAAHQVAEALIGLARNEGEAKLTGGEQSHQPLGIASVGLHPVTGSPGDRPRRHHANVKPAPVGLAHEHESRRAGLIHRRHRTVEFLQEHRHHALGLATQALHAQLACGGVKNGGDRPRLVNVEPDKGHTLRHGRHLP